VTSDADELATRLERIRDLTERLGSVQANSVEARELSDRIHRETSELNRPLTPTAKDRK
jgi:hypothetical protein